MLNRSVSPDDPTHHHQSRYAKSRLFGYLPDLPSDVIACMNPVMLNPSPHRGYDCLRVQTHHHHSRYPKSRLFGYLPDLPYVISCMKAGTQKVDFLGTSQIYRRTSLPEISDPSPPEQLPKKSTFWVPPRFTIRDLLHERRYPKSRLFGYLPDLPSDVVACMNPVMLNPSPHKGYHCPRI